MSQQRSAATPKSVGDWVRVSRTIRRWTQAELAERAGTTRQVVARLEAGAPGVRLDNYLRIMDALAGPVPQVQYTDPEPRQATAQDLADILERHSGPMQDGAA